MTAQQKASSIASNLSAAESVSSARQEGAGPSVSRRHNIPTACEFTVSNLSGIVPTFHTADSDRVDPSEASLKANSR